jgi:hypothetical protein
MGAGAKAAAPATAAKNKTDLRMLCSMMQKTEALLLLYDAVSLQDPANSKMHLSTIYFCTKGKYFISLSKNGSTSRDVCCGMRFRAEKWEARKFLCFSL